MVRAFFLLVVLAAATGCAQSPGIPGCYAVVPDRWIPSLKSDSIYHRLPARVHLDTVAASHGGRRLSPNIVYPYPSTYPGTPRWTVNGDSVVLLWSNGFAATRVVLRRVGASLRGQAFATSDAIGPDPFPHAAIRLDPVPCSP